MRKSKVTEEQIAYALRQVEGGARRRMCAGSSAAAKLPSTSGRRIDAAEVLPAETHTERDRAMRATARRRIAHIVKKHWMPLAAVRAEDQR